MVIVPRGCRYASRTASRGRSRSLLRAIPGASRDSSKSGRIERPPPFPPRRTRSKRLRLGRQDLRATVGAKLSSAIDSLDDTICAAEMSAGFKYLLDAERVLINWRGANQFRMVCGTLGFSHPRFCYSMGYLHAIPRLINSYRTCTRRAPGLSSNPLRQPQLASHVELVVERITSGPPVRTSA